MFLPSWMPNGHKGDGVWYVNLLGTALSDADKSGSFVLYVCYDSEGSHKLIDDSVLGEEKAIDIIRDKQIPFFKDLT